MINSEFLKVNEPNVVHETIDGEAILLDLKTGNYFSLDGAGAIIWDYIALTGNWRKAIDIMAGVKVEQKDHLTRSIEQFIENLIDEELLVALENGSTVGSESGAKHENSLKAAASDFKEPRVNKYSDMQDLLLLDPIHDVDEKGWPEAPNPPDVNPPE